jgi:hypothetical protein
MSVSSSIREDSLGSVRIDEVSASLIYIGEATTGASDSSPLWRIRRLQLSGTVTSIQYADGDTQFDNVWSNRASLSYS